MSTMESLNAQYIKALKIDDVLRQYEEKIEAEMNSRGQTDRQCKSSKFYCPVTESVQGN